MTSDGDHIFLCVQGHCRHLIASAASRLRHVLPTSKQSTTPKRFESSCPGFRHAATGCRSCNNGDKTKESEIGPAVSNGPGCSIEDPTSRSKAPSARPPWKILTGLRLNTSKYIGHAHNSTALRMLVRFGAVQMKNGFTGLGQVRVKVAKLTPRRTGTGVCGTCWSKL